MVAFDIILKMVTMIREPRQSTGLFALATTLSFLLSSVSSAQQIQVPYFLDDAIVVNAIINEKPARFLFDTGSSQTALFKSGVDRMGIATEPAGKIVIAGHEVERRATPVLDVAIFGKKIQQRFPVLPFQHTYDAVLGWRDLPVPLLIDGRNRAVSQQHSLPPTGDWKSWKMEADNSQLFFLVTKDNESWVEYSWIQGFPAACVCRRHSGTNGSKKTEAIRPHSKHFNTALVSRWCRRLHGWKSTGLVT